MDQIVQFSYMESRRAYAALLSQADILPVTSNQDFFGGSIVEAIHCGCFPLLPNRLAYPELLPERYHRDCIYETETDLTDQLVQLIREGVPKLDGLSQSVLRFDWREKAPEYDALFQEMVR